MSNPSITGEATEEALEAIIAGATPATMRREIANGTRPAGPLSGRRRPDRAAVYFLLPLYATAAFGFSTGKHFTLQPLWDGLADDGFHSSLVSERPVLGRDDRPGPGGRRPDGLPR
jgi:hypothetical protein